MGMDAAIKKRVSGEFKSEVGKNLKIVGLNNNKKASCVREPVKKRTLFLGLSAKSVLRHSLAASNSVLISNLP